MKSKYIIYFYRFSRIAVSIVFIWAGTVKLMDPQNFAQIISAYGLVPQQLLGFVAIGLPVMEILFGIGLIFDLPLTLEAITLMLIVFVSILWFAILKDLSVDCGCFSKKELNSQSNLRLALYRDYIFLGIITVLFAIRFIHKRNIFYPYDFNVHFWKKIIKKWSL